MKKILLVLTLLVLTPLAQAEPDSCEVFELMDQSQQMTLKDSYAYGLPYGYEWILPAQAWKESSAGKNLFLNDIRGGSHGIYQSLLDNVLWREFEMRLDPTLDSNGEPTAVKAPDYIIAYTKELLYTSHAFAAKHAILELQFWKPRTGSEWSMLASYNGGYRGPTIKDAQRYANKIGRYKQLLKTCKNSPLYGYQ